MQNDKQVKHTWTTLVAQKISKLTVWADLKPISHTELSVLAALNLCRRLKSSSKHVIRLQTVQQIFKSFPLAVFQHNVLIIIPVDSF